MIKFIKTKDKGNLEDISNVIFTMPNDISIEDLLQEFECFMKACGYHFEGELDLVNREDI